MKKLFIESGTLESAKDPASSAIKARWALTAAVLTFVLLLIPYDTIVSAEEHALADNSEFLIRGTDLSQWRRRAPNKPVAWFVASSVGLDTRNPGHFTTTGGTGVMVSGTGKSHDLYSSCDHGDGELHVEFIVAEGSNSGVYFQGRYEIQIFDSFGRTPKYNECGGIYQRWIDDRGFEGHAPRVNASKRAGTWQSFNVTFHAPRFDGDGTKTENARFVKVYHNGVVIHENVEVTGPTRGAGFSNEEPTGPLMLQGDHGLIAYRKIKLRPLHLD